METITDYTDKNITITDIRLKKGRKKGDDFFAITLSNIEDVVFVNYNIFNDRIRAFFLGKDVKQVSREEILNLKWNFIITEGYYLKIAEKDQFERVEGMKGKKYVSVLEIAGPIGEFINNFSREVKVSEPELTHA